MIIRSFFLELNWLQVNLQVWWWIVALMGFAIAKPIIYRLLKQSKMFTVIPYTAWSGR